MVERPRFRAVLLLCSVLLYPALVSAQAAAVVGNVRIRPVGSFPACPSNSFRRAELHS